MERLRQEQAAREKAETRLRDANADLHQLNSRMALYSQWAGVGGQDALMVRQWAKQDQKLHAHMHDEREQRDRAWFRLADLQATDTTRV